VDAKPKRLTGPSLTEFLAALRIPRVDPVGRSSASGELSDETQLAELLRKGDPLSPGPGRVAEDAGTLNRLFAGEGELACFGLTPDGHLNSYLPIVFDADVAAEQVIRLMEADIATDDREEALAATWLVLAYHDHDHPADFGGLLRDASGDGKPKCCYVDVKGTRAASPHSQRTKLEQRAQERKFGLLAQTVTSAADNGFSGYPGRGKPGLMATLLHNPVTASKSHSGYAMGWFFGVRSNYQATAAVWGWGGSLGVKLPGPLMSQLEAATTPIGEQTTSLLEMLRRYQDYSQFKDAQGQWHRQSLRSTLQAMFLASRYLLMQEDPFAHAEQTVENLQPGGVDSPLSPEDFHPGESFATYYGRKADREKRRADAAVQDKLKAEEEQRKAEEALRKAEDAQRRAEEEQRKTEEAQRKTEAAQRKAEENVRALVTRLRQWGKTDPEIAEVLGCAVEELLQRYPEQT